MEGSEHQDTEASARDTSEPRDGAPYYSTPKSNTPEGTSREETGTGETEVKSVLQPEDSYPRQVQEMLPVARDSGGTEEERKVYKRCRQASKEQEVQDCVGNFERARGDLHKTRERRDKPNQAQLSNVGNVYRTMVKLVICVLIPILLLALIWPLMVNHEKRQDFHRLGLSHYEKGEYESALERFLQDLEIQHARGDTANLVTTHINVAKTYILLDKTDLATFHFNTALQMAQQTGDLHGQMEVYFTMGEMQREQLHSTSTAIQYFESAMSIAKETGNKQQQMDISLELGDLHREQLHEPNKSYGFYTDMLDLARDLERKEEERLAYHRLGLACEDMQDHKKALEWHEEDLKMGQEEGDKKGQITSHKNIARSYKALGKLGLIKCHYRSAMTIAMETGDKQEQMDIYFKLGDLHREQLHKPHASHELYTEMLELAIDMDRKDEERLAYNRLGLASGNMQDHEAAVEWHQKHLTMSQEDGDKTAQISAHRYVAASYQALGKLDNAKSHYEDAMTVVMETGNKQEQMEINLKLGDLHRVQLHEPQVSHKYYTEMLKLAKDLERKDQERQAYNRLGLACEDMENHEAALEWFQKHLKMSQEDEDKKEQMIAYQSIAGSYQALGKLDLTKSHYELALTIAKATLNKQKQMDIYYKWGDLHREQLHEPQVSRKYYTEMLQLARDLGRKDKERQAYNRLGLACGDMQDHEAALELNEEYLKMSQEDGDKKGQMIAHQSIARSYAALKKLGLTKSHYLSAMTLAMETGNKQEQMDIYYKLGDLHREQLHEPQVAHEYYTEMLKLARDLERKDEERLAYNRLGLACEDMQDHEKALGWHQKYMKMSQGNGDNKEQITAHQKIARSYKALGKLDLVKSHYESAIEIATETGDKQQQIAISLWLGDLHREQLQKPQVSREYYKEMLTLARDLEKKDDEMQAYNRLGLACGDMKDHEAALGWHQKNLEMSQEKENKIPAHKNMANSYKALGKLDQARPHYESALDIAMETGDKQELMEIYLSLGDLHREQIHEPQVSHQYYTEMLELARDMERKDQERQAYNRLGVACEDMDKHEEALEWHQKYLKMSQEDGDKERQMIAHQHIADSYAALGKLGLSKSHYRSAVTLAMETGNIQMQMTIYFWLGDLHKKQLHEPQVSLQYYADMLALARDLGRKDQESLAYISLGLACEDMQEHETALEWFEKCLKMSQEDGDKVMQILTHRRAAYSYKALAKPDQARSHYQSAMTIAKETESKQEQMHINRNLGDLHREQLHEPQVSRKYYTEMLELARDLESKEDEGLAYNRLGLACGDMQDHEAALEWFQKDLKMPQKDAVDKIITHKHIADSYQTLGKLDQARSHYQCAMDIAMETGNKLEQMDTNRKLGDLHRVQLHEPKVSHKYYTEMLKLAKDSERKDREVVAYNRLGVAYGDMQDHEAALGWFQKSLKMSQETGDKERQMQAHKCTAYSYQTLGKPDQARSHYQCAMDIAKETGNKLEQMGINLKLGDLHREQLHEPQVSLTYYTEMLQLARDLERKDDERLAYNRLGLVCFYMQNHEAALGWFQKCLKMSQEDGNTKRQMQAHRYIGDFYNALGKPDLAKSHYESALTIVMETGNKQEQMDINLQLGDLHWEQLHEPRVSQQYYTMLLILAKDLENKDKEKLAYNRLGMFHNAIGEYAAALDWNKKSLKMCQENGDKKEQLTAHQNIAASYQALGKPDLAKSHYESAMTIAMETGNKQEQDLIAKSLAGL